VRSPVFFIVAMLVGLTGFACALWFGNDYIFYAGFVVLQFIVLATAWNILGGYCGYVNFGSAGFFAVGAYSTVALHKLAASTGRYFPDALLPVADVILPLSLPMLIVIAGVVAGIIGLGTGYLTLRLRGAFFAIATLALAVVLQTLVLNWSFVGGARGAYIIAPQSVEVAGFQLSVARLIERSRLGYGFATIRDDEIAAEACGVPTLRLKLIATTISGALMGMAGAPFPYYIGYVDPGTAFGLSYGVNSIAMPMIGGTTSWIGPLIGAILLGTLQQIATVTISSAVNLLIVGILLIGFVIMSPNGIVGLYSDFVRATAPSKLSARVVGILVLASYCFIVGLGGVVFGLAAAMGAKNSILAGLGVVEMVLSLAYLASAYGLTKLDRWSPLFTTATLAISIPLSFTYIWLDSSTLNVVIHACVLVIDVVAIWYLQRAEVTGLYRSETEQRVTS
jgi:branched-chain amino acid transport system permease protein